MADTLGRIIRRPAAGGGSTSDLYAAGRALGSGSAQIAITSDLNQLGAESAWRTLRADPGFAQIDQPSPTLPTIFGPLAVADFDWRSPLLSPNPANRCLGCFTFHRNATSATAWPNIVFRARVETHGLSSDFLGAILVVSPGEWRTPQVGDPYAWTIVPGNGGAWADLDLTIPDTTHSAGPLTDAAFEAVVTYPMLGTGGTSGVPAIGEPIIEHRATVWCAFFSSYGKVQVLGITLATEPP